MAPLSASGARIRGDDYQHIFAWYQVLLALQSESDVTDIGIEDPEAGNVDDVTVYHEHGPNEFYQVKSSVDARGTVNIDWLTSSKSVNGLSMLQRFHRAWKDLSQDGVRPKLGLITNRLADPNDPVIVLRDSRDGTVSARLAEKASGTAAGKARLSLANHLGIEEGELIEFLSNLQLTMGKLDDDWREQVRLLMFALGLHSDGAAIQLGINTIRGWVTTGERRLSREEISKEVNSLGLQGKKPSSVLVIHAIDRDPIPVNADVILDWVDYYEGEEPRMRRRLLDDELWNSKLRVEVNEAAKQVRASGHSNILVRGYMRLPTWFMVGTEFAKTAGFEVVSFQAENPWSSTGHIAAFPVHVINNTVLGDGKDLAIGVSLSAEVSQDVLPYLSNDVASVGTYISIIPEKGPSNQSIRNGAEARGFAFHIRDLVRQVVYDCRPPKLHLFLATPQGAALLLGHVWDRMPTTQLYEDQGVSKGYLPSFLIPN